MSRNKSRPSRRTATPRQRTLRATLDRSYELLSEAEQKLFGRLSVFWGGWTLEAAVAGEGIEEDDVLDLLGRLVDKSLVIAEANGSGRAATSSETAGLRTLSGTGSP